MRRAARLREVAGDRFVGPYGLGGGPIAACRRAAAARRRRPRTRGAAPCRASTSPARTCRRRASTSPTSSRRTARRSSRVANGKLERGRRRAARSRGCSTRCSSTPAGATSCCCTATGCSCSRAAATGPSRCRRSQRVIAPYAAVAVGALRGRRLRSGALRARPHADARRLVRRGAARRRDRPHRRRLADPGGAAVRAARRLDPGRARRGDEAQPRRLASSRVASWLPSYRIKRAGATPAAKRPLVQCRHVRRPAGFSGLGMLTVLTVDLAKGLEPVDSTAVMTDGRIVYASPDEPLRRDRALGRPARPGRRRREEQSGVTTAIHKFDISSPTKTRLPRQRQGVRATCSASGRCRSSAACCASSAPRRPAWWGEGGDVRVVPDDAAPRRTARSSRRAASAGSARASASTRCASSATPATSSPSARSTRSTRSTSPTRSGRACSAS